MSYILSHVFNQPLLTTEDHLSTILAVVGPKVGLDISGLEAKGKPKDDSPLYSVSHGSGVINVKGTLSATAMPFNALSGMTSYEDIGASFDAAMADPEVKQIVLHVDSPGGTVKDVFDLSDRIYNSRGTKPIYAIANDSMTSAAYLIASAVDKIYATRTASIGSIGVVATYYDTSSADEKRDVKPINITFGTNKVLEGDEAVSYLQSRVDETGELFLETVARNRGITVEAVRDTEASVYGPTRALELGLIDEIATAETKLNLNGVKQHMEELEALKAAITSSGLELVDGKLVPQATAPEPIIIAGVEVPEGTSESLVARLKELAAIESASASAAQEAELSAAATEAFPALSQEDAIVLYSMAVGNDSAMEALKRADAILATATSETGDTQTEDFDNRGDLDKFKASVREYQDQNKVSYSKAYSAVASTAEGKTLLNAHYANKRES